MFRQTAELHSLFYIISPPSPSLTLADAELRVQRVAGAAAGRPDAGEGADGVVAALVVHATMDVQLTLVHVCHKHAGGERDRGMLQVNVYIMSPFRQLLKPKQRSHHTTRIDIQAM